MVFGTTGATMATTAKGGMRAFHYLVLPADSGHAKIPYSYPYRCPVGAPPEHCAEACLEFTRRMLLGKESPFTEHRAGVSNVAAVLLEPMQASAGYIIPGDGSPTTRSRRPGARARTSAPSRPRRWPARPRTPPWTCTRPRA